MIGKVGKGGGGIVKRKKEGVMVNVKCQLDTTSEES